MKTLSGFRTPSSLMVAIVLASTLGSEAFSQDLLIKDVKEIHTAAGQPIKNASILIKDGKIAAIGGDITVSEDVRQIDASSLIASPGIIDAHSHLGVDGSVNEGSDSITCEVRIADVLNAEDPTIYRALAGGCTAAHIMHGSANVIGGQNASIKLKWESTPEQMIIKDAPRTVKFALGENPKRSNSRIRGDSPRRFPTSRMGVEALLREAFTSARTYEKTWKLYRDNIAMGKVSQPPRRDLRKDALVDILHGKIDIHCHCYRADEILMILQIAEEFGLKIRVLHHVLEGYKVAPEMAAHGAGGSTFADWWAYKMEAYDAVPYNAAIMHRAGVLTSIKSDSGDHIRRLNVEAAKCIKYGGLTPLEALQMVTLNPAIQLRLDHRIGSIQKGKDADIVLWNGSPLSTTSIPYYTIVDGKVEFDRKADMDKRTGSHKMLASEKRGR